jgi:CDP-6-deoxy-D-xylo-4-hexulose-3-dehydrase
MALPESTVHKHTKKIWYAPNKFESYGDEEIKAVEACLRNGWLAPGPITDQFECEVAAIFGKKFGVMANSGSSANILALLIAGLKAGDEVITPACTFSTTVAPIVQLGLVPIFCDVEIGSYVPSVAQIIEKVSPRTKAFFIPNLIGSKPNWQELKDELFKLGREDILLIEDSCDTITYTTITDISVTSFYSSHIITAGGGGGMVMCNDKSQRDLALQYRDWGRMGTNTEAFSERFDHCVDGIEYDFKFLYPLLGYNLKSTEMNAAFGLEQLKKLPLFLEKRRKNIDRYVQQLKELEAYGLVLPKNHDKVDWLALPLMLPNRKALLQKLEDSEIQTRVCFAGNITRHPAYRQYYKVFPNADEIMKNGFLVGAHHGMDQKDVDYVCEIIKMHVHSSQSSNHIKE